MKSRELARSAGSLADASSLPVFSDLTENPSVCQQNLKLVSKQTDDFKQQIDEYEKSLDFSQSTYIFGLTRGYAELRARHNQSQVAINQTRQVIERYELMAKFLTEFTSIRAEQIAVTNKLAETPDLNTYAGRTYELRQDAASLERLALRLSSMPTPVELVPLRDRIAVYYRELTAGYSDLADGIDIAIDDVIYTAARRIEFATEGYYRDIPPGFSRAMEASTTLKEVRDLTDKFTNE